jgi:hypothetical protein
MNEHKCECKELKHRLNIIRELNELDLNDYEDMVKQRDDLQSTLDRLTGKYSDEPDGSDWDYRVE